jgi:hypothetical protein
LREGPRIAVRPEWPSSGREEEFRVAEEPKKGEKSSEAGVESLLWSPFVQRAVKRTSQRSPKE